MDDFKTGDIVLSLCGRDGGKYFYVLAYEEPFVFLADGRIRKIEKPKTKKVKHVKFSARLDDRTSVKLREGQKVSNPELRRALTEYSGQNTCCVAEEENHG